MVSCRRLLRFRSPGPVNLECFARLLYLGKFPQLFCLKRILVFFGAKCMRWFTFTYSQSW